MQLWFYQLTVGFHENIAHVNLIDWNIKYRVTIRPFMSGLHVGLEFVGFK